MKYLSLFFCVDAMYRPIVCICMSETEKKKKEDLSFDI